MDDGGVGITLIAAVANNGVIGRDGEIPWRIPSDFRHFKQMTMGKPMVMGRKQFESVGRALPGRANIVVSAQHGFSGEGIEVFATLDAALGRAQWIAQTDGVNEVMIIGGGEVYRQTIEVADKLIISHVDLAPEGHVFFPEIDPEIWERTSELAVEPDGRDSAPYRIAIYERRHSAH